ncbi:MAG: Ig-like domain-containing protein [Lachnospiraceae bacterium]|nr:Ig-like domain-containing protein [Lachnospiraceae bacterium]
MRSFSKKLAFVLAAAMVVTAIAPAASAKAADDMAINKSSQILYVNEGINHKGAAGVAEGKGNVSEYDFYVKNKPEDWKKTLKFEWTSSDEDVATVNKSGLTTAVGVGKATISCKITKDGEVVTTAKTKVTVKANAAEVEISNAATVSGQAYEVGKTVDLNRTMYDEEGNKTTKRGTYVTDYTEWLCDKEEGVEITQSNGKYTFTKPGEYTLWCRTYQSSKYTKTTAESDKITVTVVDTNFDIKQETSKKFTVFFGQKSDVKLADVTVEQKVATELGGVENVNYMVRNVVMASDGLSASIDTFVDFVHNAEYVVKIKGFTTQTFTASVGDPESMVVYVGNAVANRQVTVGATENLKYKLYDAKNVDVTDKANSNLSSVDYEIVYSDGYTLTDNFLYFDEVGDYATVVATYHPGEKYDSNGVEVGVFKSAETKFVATAQNQASIVAIEDWGVNAWSAKDVKLDNDNNADGQLWVKLKLSDGSTQTVDYYDEPIYVGETFIGYANFTALNPDIVEVYESGTVDVYGRAVGFAPVMFSYVTNIAGEDIEVPVKSLTIEVKAKRAMKTVGYGSTSLVLSASPAQNDNSTKIENPTVSLSVKDQYGDAYGDYTVLGWEPVSKLAERATMSETVVDDANTPTFDESLITHGIAVDLDSSMVNVPIYNAEFQPLLWDVNNDLHADGTQPAGNASVGYRVRVKDNQTGTILTAQFSINFRGHIGDTDHGNQNGHALELVMNKTWLDKNNGNAARHEVVANNPHIAGEKTLVFDVFEKCNQAYYDEVAFEAWEGTTVPASTGLYYKMYRNGKDVTATAKAGAILADVLNSGAAGSGTTVTYRLSDVGTSQYDGRDIVIYTNNDETIGAGTYKFQLFEVKTVNGQNRATSVSGGMKTANVQVNTGSYKLTFRDKAKAPTTAPEDLMKCFLIADRNGTTYSHAAHEVTASTVKFGNSTRDYMIVRNYDREAQRAGETAFVEKIVFWENLGDGTCAEFVVNVNMFVEIGQ